jgi:hypothetical protein
MAAHQITLNAVTRMAILLLVGGVMAKQELETACHEGTCNANSGQDTPSSAASLMQMKRQRQPETRVLEKVGNDAAALASCTGVAAQGKCWYLSDLGKSCSTTCTKYEKSFSFAVADNTEPITPSLLGSSPTIRQQPWASLECYVQGEDRYHTANVNAAKHFVGGLGNWSHPQCQLACPCNDVSSSKNECTWKQPPACASVFEWNEVLHTGCTTVGHDAPWCMHHFHHTEEDVMSEQHWSLCEKVCGPGTEDNSIEQRCEWTLANGCEREFDYEGTHYVGCTSADHASPWCSLSQNYIGSWAQCNYSCPFESELIKEVMETVMKDDELCSWHTQPKCSNSTVYKGVTYTGCIDVDYPTPWCSHDSNHSGSYSLCRRSCNQASLSEGPEAAPTAAPAEKEGGRWVWQKEEPAPKAATAENSITAEKGTPDPCAKKYNSEDDAVGNYVSLDEAGYKTLDQLHSLPNMKRFVCRVVEKTHCKVTDNLNLMAFVQTYSSVSSHQDYAHLQDELTALCHAGDKWVVPAWYEDRRSF